MPNTTNEVIINGQGVMSVRGDTVTENTLVQGETATNKKGEKITGTLNTESKEDISSLNDKIDSLSDTAYMINDDEGEITEADYIPFYDVSDEDNPKKKVVLGELSQRIGEQIGVYSPHTYDMGTAIPENDDLNDYISEGVFYVPSNSVAETISNIPVSSAGKLIVMNRDTGARLFQIYISSENNIYMRAMDNNYVFFQWRNIARAHSFELGTAIPANSDLNDYTTVGAYNIELDATAKTIANIPVGNAGKLVVCALRNSSNIKQVYHVYSNFKVFSRIYNNGWTNWTNIYSATQGNDIVLNHQNGSLWSQIKHRVNGDKRLYVNSSLDGGSTWDGDKQIALTSDISPSTVGNGYAVATVSGSTITATISGFQLRVGVIVALQFTTNVTTDCTLNISNTGAKSVKYWNNETVSVGKEIAYGVYTFIYDGTYYRVLGHERSPLAGVQDYVADTSGNLTITWGYGVNRAQIKYNLSSDVLVWNYYKNSAWRGDKVILDVMGGQTMEGWLGLKGGAGRTIASGAHSMGVQDTIPNILNELRYSNGAWGSFNLTTAYTKDYTTIPTGWYNYFYIPHRVGGENWATPTSWDADNVYFGTLLLYGMNNTNGMFRIRMHYTNSAVSITELEDMQKGNCYVGTCTTAGGTKDKVATVDGNFVLRKGVRVAIKFSNNNTYSNVTSSPITLNVNSTGAKNIWYWQNHSGAGNTGTNTTIYGYANRYINYYYDGTYWVWDGMSGEANDNQQKSFYGTCSTAGDQQVKVVTLADTSGWELRAGTIVGVKFTNTNTYSATADAKCQLNVNNTGAKNIYYNTGYTTGTNSTVFGVANRVHYYMYNGTDWCWMNHGLDLDTVDPRVLGFGYGTCATAEATTAKVATLASYTLRTGGIVSIKFTYNVPANATLNINSRGAKEIWNRGAKITNTIIRAGDIATFIYDGTRYHLIANDKANYLPYDYTYDNSAGTPKGITFDDTSIKITQMNYVVKGDIVNVSFNIQFSTAKSYSTNTKLFHGLLAPKQVVFCECQNKPFYLDKSGAFFIRGTSVTASTYWGFSMCYIRA